MSIEAPLVRRGTLDGVAVLDLSRILSGPFCTAILGDHGADVVKVESPDGDDTRRFGPPFVAGESTYFLSCNRNKRSIALDLKHPAGKAALLALCAKADVLVENFRPGALERLGLGPDVLQADNPGLVVCRISGFGQSGPWRDRPGYDLAVQGLSGLQALTGAPGGEPFKLGVSIADLVTGLYAAQSVLASLLGQAREKLARRAGEATQAGDVIDVAMLDCVASLLSFQAQRTLSAAEAPRRMGNQHPSIAPYETFAAADGWLNVTVGNDKLWLAFCDVLQRPALATDPRFVDNPSRVANRAALVAAVGAVLAVEPRAHWIARMEAAGVPGGPILEVEEMLAHPSLLARGRVTEIEHAAIGALRLLSHPVGFSRSQVGLHRAPPLLGEHGREVLKQWLGWGDAEVDALAQSGALFAAGRAR